VWGPLTCLFSVPSFAYALSASLPPDNTFSIGSEALEAVYHGAGLALYFVSAYVIPCSARVVAHKVGSDAYIAGGLIVVARLIVVLLVPFCATLVMHEGCHSVWLQFWEPCTIEQAFTTTIKTSADIYYPISVYSHLIVHEDVCQPTYSPAKCPRGVIDVLGGLLTSKMMVTAFVGPPVSLFMALPAVQHTVQGVVRRVMPGYNTNISIDREVAGVVMLLEIGLVLGFCVPWLIPLCGIALGLQACVVHVSVLDCGMPLADEARPSVSYLWVSLALGWGLVVWFFFSCALSGQWLVAIGAPLTAAGTLGVAEVVMQYLCIGPYSAQDRCKQPLEHARGGSLMCVNPLSSSALSMQESYEIQVRRGSLDCAPAAQGPHGGKCPPGGGGVAVELYSMTRFQDERCPRGQKPEWAVLTI